ncbi:MAG: cytochrome c oxidase subunit 3 family protein [Bacteroidales bacterium]
MADVATPERHRQPTDPAVNQVHALEHEPHLMHHFDDMGQQREAATLGMWVFLITEVLFFGGLFTAYMVYRVWYPSTFGIASRELSIWSGSMMTVVLITSSLTMAMAVHAAALGKRTHIVGFLGLTLVLGIVFVAMKFMEYYHEYLSHHIPGHGFQIEGADPNNAQIFFSLYFTMTGLHALHMFIGFGIILTMMWMAWRNYFSERWHTPVEVAGLYWHFVDIIWIFLFPLLYLIDRHK